MTRVDRMSELLSALRQQLTSKAESRRTEASSASDAGDDLVQSEKAETLTDLRRRLGRELKRYDLGSKLELKQARQNFFESVLAWDLGEQLPRDPRFGLMIRDVEETIAADERTSNELDQLIVFLQNDSLP
ncbi:MAG: hypothetical protein JWR16_1196 [Nevskia sp.]|nr:hypothetical protein [Nevskia sp.]